MHDVYFHGTVQSQPWKSGQCWVIPIRPSTLRRFLPFCRCITYQVMAPRYSFPFLDQDLQVGDLVSVQADFVQVPIGSEVIAFQLYAKKIIR
jgi:hypothetical protein